ncbi:HAMP domain-containing sensor histidine kinase [Actinomycetospora sp. TBRC 11914]|uniref:sensor histidine kinase n=1 Tax=Actinomycetospora sp. TBRC 11914 TaxID=2729387 RepID=UPI00145D69DF|nr:HAMP domain-containing sensor histidine kinase [Actinomycetospora sp. TBRC 11914]NMO90863.1 HAMP domain-containing histidine kinase [Actinomycetospora sp. TBRC 11914]
MTRWGGASLRRRVTVTSVVVVAVVVVVVAVVSDLLFAAQSRSEALTTLNGRALQAVQLADQGLSPDQIVRRVEIGGGIVVVVRGPDGAVLAANRAGDPPSSRRTVSRRLASGDTVSLTADPGLEGAAERRLRRVLLIVGGIAIVAAAGALLLTTRLALAPLDAMTTLARSIAGGRRGERLAPERRDTELGRAAAAFDEMLDALEGAEAHARASEASTRRFVADAAHELRTPLAGIAATAEAGTAPGLDPEARERLATLLVRDARRAGRLVDDLLTLARYDAGLRPERSRVDLVELARVETDRDAVLHPDDPAELEGGAPVPVSVDPELLGQALTNLVTNARRHGGGAVTVSVGRDGGAARVAVRDHGPGVPQEERERVFDRMVRLDEARGGSGGRGGGAGLGLAIAREAARAHGGDLVCRAPDDSGPGAEFVLTLPADG